MDSVSRDSPKPPSARRRRFARSFLRVFLTALLAGYALLAISLYCLQDRMIFSGQRTQGLASSVVHPPAGTELVRLRTAQGDGTVALFGPAQTPDGEARPDAARRPTVLYFYGNAMCLNDCMGQFSLLRRLGVNVLIPEYIGYGMSAGRPSEADCYAVADAAYDHLLKRSDIDPKRIVAVGWSLGGAVAIDLASRRPVIGLATFSAFSSMGGVAARQFPILPISLMLRSPFRNEEKIKRITCPILLGHGTEDALVPFSMSAQLAAAAGGSVTRLPIKGAGHNDIFAVGGNDLWRPFGKFLNGL